VPSAKADSVSSIFVFPALMCRLSRAVATRSGQGLYPPSRCSIQFRTTSGKWADPTRFLGRETWRRVNCPLRHNFLRTVFFTQIFKVNGSGQWCPLYT
jgi:hypothetical protein